MDKCISLNGQWKLLCLENKDVKKNKLSFCTLSEMSLKANDIISAAVPGNFELDLFNAGIIDDPFYGSNIIGLQWLENRHLWYAKSFEYSGENTENVFLRFDGIDTFSEIYLNGVLIGTTDNMLISYEFAAVSLKNGENELVVHIKPTHIEVRNNKMAPALWAEMYNNESLHIRKAPHMFGWDIMPRVISGGIWRDVFIVEKAYDRIDDLYVMTASIDVKKQLADLVFCYNATVSEDYLDNYTIRITGKCDDSEFSFENRIWHTSGRFYVTLSDCRLWWPKGRGRADLYDIKAELLCDGKVLDTYTLKTGIRTVTLKRTSTVDDNGKGEFCFYVNGERLFIMGTNWVPMDAFHSRDKQRLPKALELLNDSGCNMVRCWGGNVYEDDLFYDFCDENGILIWQDFAMACGAYPQTDDFLKSITNEVNFVIERLRNHPSIALWAGDNECDVACEWRGLNQNPNDNVITRRVIPQIVLSQDPVRMFLPSSPYVDSIAFNKGYRYLPEDHLWGPRDFYKGDFYNNSLALFASETGYHGSPSPESVKKFISPERIWPWQNNPEWVVHATSPETDSASRYGFRIELMSGQIKVLFGIEPDNLDTYAMLSQISQAEAYKTFIERFRTAKWNRTGIIWWNLIDGWPQFSDAVVDYYYTKKLAYHYIKASQQQLCLMFKEPENGKLSLIAANDYRCEKKITFKVYDLSNENQLVLSGDTVVLGDTAKELAALDCDGNQHFYLITWQDENGNTAQNHYLAGKPTFDYNEYIKYAKQIGIFNLEGFN